MGWVYSWTFTDRSNEKSSVTFNALASAADDATRVTARDAIQTALGTVTSGIIRARRRGLYELLDGSIPAAAGAKREYKMRIDYQDTVTNKLHQYEVPTVDENAITYQGNQTDYLNLEDGGVVENFVTQIETYVGSPEGNAITIIGIEGVGRNL